MFYYLRLGEDYLGDAERYRTKAGAIAAFKSVAEELGRYGQSMGASLHVAAYKDDLAEYPDFVLSLGPRGGVRCERC